MCYKDNKQRMENEKLDSKIKDMPQFIKDYFVFLSSSGSKLNYWSNLRKLFEWLISEGIIKNTLENMTPDDLKNVSDVQIIKYLDGLRMGLYGEKTAITTLDTKKNIFSSFWTYLVENEYVNKNVAARIPKKKYKSEQKEVHVPTEEEISEFLNNIESIKSEFTSLRNIAIVKLLMGSGIRIDELTGLDMNDLYISDECEDKQITVIRKGSQGEENKVEVLINNSAVMALDEYLKARNNLEDINTTNAVFVSDRREENGNRKRVEKVTIQGFFSKYSNGKISPHDFRHYFGTKMYESTNNIVNVCAQLGHHDINTTKKYYVKTNKEHMKNDINSF